jgi:prepilin-type N-terminal cleavage/methylation domain-containing protein
MFAKRNALRQRRRRDGDGGFTLAEVLLAVFIIAIAFVALLSTIPYSSAAVQGGNQTSTATFLANQKLEEAKNVPWTATPGNDCLGISAGGTAAPSVPAGGTCTLNGVVLGAGTALPWAADQGATAIPNFSGYSRSVRITDCTVSPALCTGIADAAVRLVTVSVTFRPMTTSSTAAAPKTVTVSMLVAER